MIRCVLFVAVLSVAVPRAALADDEAAPTVDDEAVFQCRKSKSPVRVSFKEEVSIQELITWAMGFSCKNFLLGSDIKTRSKKVMFVTPKLMTSAQAWRAFLVGLRAMGLTIVQKDNVLQIVESAQAKRHLPRVVAEARDGERYQRAIFRSEHASIGEMERALSALKSDQGEVLALQESGVLLVSDYGSHLRGMAAMVREIDRPRTDEHVYVIRVKHGDVAQIASTVEAIVGTGDAAAPPRAARRGSAKNKSSKTATRAAPAPFSAAPTKILTDERTSTIIVLGSDAAFQRASALVRRLDEEMSEADSGHIHMYLLEHADAEEMATTLQSLVSNRPATPKTEGRQTEGRKARPAARPSIDGDVKVTFDNPSNALLVMASMQDYLSMREVIRRLDTRRQQVFIEATILDIRVDGEKLLRGAFHGGQVKNGAVWLSGLQYDNLKTTDVKSVLGLTGMLTGIIGGEQSILGSSIPSFAVLFQALATSRNANILSAPRVMTMDNTEALISVGQRVPIVRGELAAPGPSGLSTTRSIDREDVSLTLKVTPHVNSLDEVRLEIDLNIEDIVDSDPDLGPTTSKREVKNTVVVNDQESIVIGGLVSDETIKNEFKVPLLGDIPVVGHLFKRTRREKRKRNLLILLTPYIVNDRADSQRILREKLREREEFARAFSGLRAAKHDPKVDYRRKRGLVEDINRAVLDIEAERRLIEEIEQPDTRRPDGRVWPPQEDAR